MKRTTKENLVRVATIAVLMFFFQWLGIRNHPDNVRNPDNQPYRLEIAFNLGIDMNDVTQAQFNERYGTTLRVIRIKN